MAKLNRKNTKKYALSMKKKFGRISFFILTPSFNYILRPVPFPTYFYYQALLIPDNIIP